MCCSYKRYIYQLLPISLSVVSTVCNLFTSLNVCTLTTVLLCFIVLFNSAVEFVYCASNYTVLQL